VVQQRQVVLGQVLLLLPPIRQVPRLLQLFLLEQQRSSLSRQPGIRTAVLIQ
jgi:hypothetical protein